MEFRSISHLGVHVYLSLDKIYYNSNLPSVYLLPNLGFIFGKKKKKVMELALLKENPNSISLQLPKKTSWDSRNVDRTPAELRPKHT